MKAIILTMGLMTFAACSHKSVAPVPVIPVVEPSAVPSVAPSKEPKVEPSVKPSPECRGKDCKAGK